MHAMCPAGKNNLKFTSRDRTCSTKFEIIFHNTFENLIAVSSEI